MRSGKAERPGSKQVGERLGCDLAGSYVVHLPFTTGRGEKAKGGWQGRREQLLPVQVWPEGMTSRRTSCNMSRL